jgi:hypothetical protein
MTYRKMFCRINKSISAFALFIFLLTPITSAYTLKNSCSRATTFSIGNVDPKFNLSREDVISYSKEAAKFWNDGLGENLFEYKETGGKVKINFVYDERQVKSLEKAKLKNKQKVSEIALEDDFDLLDKEKKEFAKLKNVVEAKWDDYSKRLSVYNKEVTDLNQTGISDANVINRLNDTKSKLDTERESLEKETESVNSRLTTLNAHVDKFNASLKEYNKLIDAINKDAGKQFEQGVFQNNKITIYEFEDVNNLKRLLAHELGHSLRMNHTKNKESIMYYLNTGTKLMIAPEDIIEFYRVCTVK